MSCFSSWSVRNAKNSSLRNFRCPSNQLLTRLIVSLSVRMNSSSNRLQMLNSHPKNCQLIKFPGHCVTHRNHTRKFCDISVHFIASSFFNLRMILPKKYLCNAQNDHNPKCRILKLPEKPHKMFVNKQEIQCREAKASA